MILVTEIEAASAESLNQNWERVMDFIAQAESPHELTARALAMGQVQVLSGFKTDAYFACTEAAGHYDSAGLPERALEARERAGGLRASAFPPFMTAADLEVVPPLRGG